MEKSRISLQSVLLSGVLVCVGAFAAKAVWHEMNDTDTTFYIANVRDGDIVKGKAEVDVFTADGSLPGSDLRLDLLWSKFGGGDQNPGLIGIASQTATGTDGNNVRRFTVRTTGLEDGVYYLQIGNGSGAWEQKRWVRVRN